MEGGTSRRRFLQGLGAAGAFFTVIPLSACGRQSGTDGKNSGSPDSPGAGAPAANGDPCSDLSGLTPAQVEFRADAEYVAESIVPGEDCDDCKYWTPPRNNAPCGGCTAVAGPIHAGGHCSLWEEREEDNS